MLGVIRTFVMGPAPVLARLIDWLGWVDVIDQAVARSDCKLSVGLRTKALLINVGTDREALYRVEEFYAKRRLLTITSFDSDLPTVIVTGNRASFSRNLTDTDIREGPAVGVRHAGCMR